MLAFEEDIKTDGELCSSKLHQMMKSLTHIYFNEFLAAFILLIIFDQSTKILIAKIMLENMFESIEVLPFLNIVFVRNTGISFGLLVMVVC